MNTNLSEIIDKFKIKGKIINIDKYGEGHINDTFIVETATDDKYILQRINKSIFKDPKGLIDNIVKISEFIKKKLIKEQYEDIFRHSLTLIQTKNNKFFHIDGDNNYWRLFDFINGGKTYETTDNSSILFEASASFGRFIRLLDDFPINKLSIIIPKFHDIKFRFSEFKKACEKDSKKRVKTAIKETEFVFDMKERFFKLASVFENGILPIRVSHNDTKINNVIIDEKTGKGLAAIDLDTVMPGYSIFDFGDLIRTSISISKEDETDLAKINIQTNRFEAVLKGFLSETKNILTKDEISNLVSGSIIMTSMIGMRFLTDYLSGDVYFKTDYPEHNLIRCRVQFKIAKEMIKNENTLNKIVAEEIK